MKLLSELKKLKAVAYNRRYARILAAMVASHMLITFDDPHPIMVLMKMPEYYYALVINALFAFIIAEWVNYVTRKLDVSKPWPFQPARRLAAQALWGFLAPVLSSIFMAIVYYGCYGYSISETKFFSQYFYLIIYMVALVNAYYIIHYAFKVVALMMDLNEKDKVIRKMDLPSAIRSKWPTQDIAFVQAAADGCFVYTSAQEKLIWTTSLEATIDNLPYKEYFLISRYAIVQVHNILKVEKSSSRRYELTLKSPAGITVAVSQGKVKGFKDWLRENAPDII